MSRNHVLPFWHWIQFPFEEFSSCHRSCRKRLIYPGLSHLRLYHTDALFSTSAAEVIVSGKDWENIWHFALLLFFAFLFRFVASSSWDIFSPLQSDEFSVLSEDLWSRHSSSIYLTLARSWDNFRDVLLEREGFLVSRVSLWRGSERFR